MKKLATSIQEGRGRGRGRGRGSGTANAYKPWIEVTRRTSSPCSNLSVVPVPHLTRLTHYLLRGEREFAPFLWWLGAIDVREQYPLWPWEHLHLAMQLCKTSKASFHPGTRVIAQEAGIPLHNYPGLDIPWILSIDLMVTVPDALSSSRLVGISCKPKEILASGSPSDRELERLELDRRYCLHADIPQLGRTSRRAPQGAGDPASLAVADRELSALLGSDFATWLSRPVFLLRVRIVKPTVLVGRAPVAVLYRISP